METKKKINIDNIVDSMSKEEKGDALEDIEILERAYLKDRQLLMDVAYKILELNIKED